MADWIYDEDITRTTVDLFNKAGIKGKHVVYDLHKSGKEDEDVARLAKKEKKTLITGNYLDYQKMSNVEFHNSYGVFILNTDNPNEQVRLVKKTIKVADLDTLSKRKELKVNIKFDCVDLINVRDNTTRTIRFEDKNEKQKTSKKR